MESTTERKVVVTSLGALSPAGEGADGFWEALTAGKDFLRPVEAFDPSPYECKLAATVPGPRREDPAGLLFGALDEALDTHGLPAGRLGLVLGTTLGGMSFLDAALSPVEGSERLGKIPYHALTDRVAARLPLTCPPATVSGACASSLIAVGLGYLWVRTDRADAVVVGGYDVYNEFVHAGFASLGALTSDTVRPFDGRRSGIVLGEGAAVLIVEEEGAALQAGRRPLARITGFACSSDANHITGPHPNGDGLLRAVAHAAAQARAGPEDFQYVLAHGTGTVYNDRMESIALSRFFGDCLPPVSSIKGAMGHTLGAAGALETVAAVRALLASIAPPTLHYTTPDPECVPDPVANKARDLRMFRVLKTASGFGGQNAALVLQRWDHV